MHACLTALEACKITCWAIYALGNFNILIIELEEGDIHVDV